MRPQPEKIISKEKKSWRHDSSGRALPSMCKALSSIPVLLPAERIVRGRVI
jgi:hypothetical protein